MLDHGTIKLQTVVTLDFRKHGAGGCVTIHVYFHCEGRHLSTNASALSSLEMDSGCCDSFTDNKTYGQVYGRPGRQLVMCMHVWGSRIWWILRHFHNIM